MTEWFENEQFWIDFYPSMFTEERFAQAVEELPQIERLLHTKGKTVLDLCCGPGRCALPLARAGYEVTGVDSTRFLLDKARAAALHENLRIEWIEDDMRTFVRPEAFDVVLSMFTSFGYCEKKEEDLNVLQNMYACLKPGGVCLLDIMGKEVLARIYQPVRVETCSDGTKIFLESATVEDWSRIKNSWFLIRPNHEVRRYDFHHAVYSGQELKSMLLSTGFATVKLYGNVDGSEYGYAAERLIAVARK